MSTAQPYHCFIIDNLDSFTYNLVDEVQRMGLRAQVIRVDQPLELVLQSIQQNPMPLLFSAGSTSPLIRHKLHAIFDRVPESTPILACGSSSLALNLYFAGANQIIPAQEHDILQTVHCIANSPLTPVEQDIQAAFYHLERIQTLSPELQPIAYAHQEVVAFQHKQRPLVGINFQLDSLITTQGSHLFQHLYRFIQQI